MRIRFLCLYFFWSSVSIADEISRNLLIDHYSFLNPSMGLGFEKENRNNQKAFAWYHTSKEIQPKIDFHLQLMALSYKRILRENFPYTDIPYKLQKKSGELLTLNLGIQFYFFSLYGNFQKANPTYKGLSLGFHLYPEKSLFLFYKENPKENTKEYALSEKQDFKEQLGRMKNKQSRIFISEAGDMFKVFKEFLEKVQNDMEDGGVVVMNLGDKIHFNSRFERATLLEGKDIGYALRQFLEFTKAALQSISVPTLKK